MPYRQATPFAPVVDEILRLTGARRVGPDRYIGHCPLPTHRHGDLRASLSIRKTSDRLLLYCFRGCSSASVLQALGFRWANLSRPLTPDERMHALEERRLQQGALQRQARAERIVADRCRLLARPEDALFERLLVAEGTEADELARQWHSILTLEREADEAWEELHPLRIPKRCPTSLSADCPHWQAQVSRWWPHGERRPPYEKYEKWAKRERRAA
jgi:hypothetical protein